MTLDKARDILKKYNTEAFLLQHGETVSAVMGYFARQYSPEQEEHWRVVGMLHDIDFEKYPEEHCIKGEEILKAEGVDESIIRSALSHGWGQTDSVYEPTEWMEKVLFAVDELTGLIGAAALMRPSKSTLDMEVSSIKKKFKDKRFAAGCSRETINQGAEMLGWTLEKLMEETLMGVREYEKNSCH